jgi:hypothetical protein
VLLQLECVANASFMKEVCEVWNIPSYCGITSDNNSLQFEAEVPLHHTVQLPSEVCLFSRSDKEGSSDLGQGFVGINGR